MTQEQYEQLKKYEQQLTTAYKLDYLRNLGQVAVNDLDLIYQGLFGHASKLKSGCPACVMQEVKKLAKEYFSYVPPKQEEEETDNKEEEPKKKKNGIRKSKGQD